MAWQEMVCITNKLITRIILFMYSGYFKDIVRLTTYEFESSFTSGVFLDFDRDRGAPIQNNFSRMLYYLVGEINQAKKYHDELQVNPLKGIGDAVNVYRNHLENTGEGPVCEFDVPFYELERLNAIYERIANIHSIAIFLIKCMDENDKNLDTPVLLNGLGNSLRPLEEDILFYLKYYEFFSNE
jgi:hypothetical protein